MYWFWIPCVCVQQDCSLFFYHGFNIPFCYTIWWCAHVPRNVICWSCFLNSALNSDALYTPLSSLKALIFTSDCLQSYSTLRLEEIVYVALVECWNSQNTFFGILSTNVDTMNIFFLLLFPLHVSGLTGVEDSAWSMYDLPCWQVGHLILLALVNTIGTKPLHAKYLISLKPIWSSLACQCKSNLCVLSNLSNKTVQY